MFFFKKTHKIIRTDLKTVYRKAVETKALNRPVYWKPLGEVRLKSSLLLFIFLLITVPGVFYKFYCFWAALLFFIDESAAKLPALLITLWSSCFFITLVRIFVFELDRVLKKQNNNKLKTPRLFLLVFVLVFLPGLTYRYYGSWLSSVWLNYFLSGLFAVTLLLMQKVFLFNLFVFMFILQAIKKNIKNLFNTLSDSFKWSASTNTVITNGVSVPLTQSIKEPNAALFLEFFSYNLKTSLARSSLKTLRYVFLLLMSDEINRTPYPTKGAGFVKDRVETYEEVLVSYKNRTWKTV